jgi:hypothetical protein
MVQDFYGFKSRVGFWRDVAKIFHRRTAELPGEKDDFDLDAPLEFKK